MADEEAYAKRLKTLPQSETTTLMRGLIHVIDVVVPMYEKCLPDEQARRRIEQLTVQRASTLKACQQISVNDNCRVSPF